MRLSRQVLLTLCISGLFLFHAELKAQSVAAPQTKATLVDSSIKTSQPTFSATKVDQTAPSPNEDNDYKFLSKPGLSTENLGFIRTSATTDCGVDKGKCSGTDHCCVIGGSGWCCAKDKKCDYDHPGDCK